MSEKTAHTLLVCFYSFFTLVFAVLFFFSPIGGVFWLLLVVLATLIHAVFKPEIWRREGARFKCSIKRLRGKLGKISEPAPNDDAYDTDFRPDHALVCLMPGRQIVHRLTQIDPEKGYIIGRSYPEFAELADNTNVSREHCKITYRRHSHEYYVEDMRSNNGTYVNTKRLEPNSPEKLLDGAVLTICGIKYRFEKMPERMERT